MSNNKPVSLKRREPLTDSNLLFLIAVSIFAFLYIFGIAFIGGGFHTFQQFFDLFNNNAALIILACGLSIVMVAGGIDISVGGVAALVTMTCAVFLNGSGASVAGAMLISVGIGLAFGLVQGFLVAYLDIQPFIITLAGMFFARGMATVISIAPVRVENLDFINLVNSKIEIGFLGRYVANGNFIPVKIDLGVLVAVVVVIGIVFIMKWSRFGRNLYAVGGNKQSALMLGINVNRTKFFSHVACGLLAGIAGFVYIMKSGSGSATNADFFEMKAIAASIIGGTMLTGGVGNIMGSPLGVLALMTIDIVVIALKLNEGRPYMQTITTGAMLCLAILLQSVVLSRRNGTKMKLALPEWLKFKKKSTT